MRAGEEEAPEDAVFGMFAFPDHRSEKLPAEPDTPQETSVLKGLINRIKHSGDLESADADSVRQCLSNGWYDKVFRRPEPGSVLYRGIRITPEALEKHVADFDGSTEGESNRTYDYNNGEKYSSSWSYSEREAWRWANPRMLGAGLLFVLQSDDNPDDLLDLSGVYSRLPLFDEYKYEKEVMGLGRLKCSGLKWKLSTKR